MEPEDELHSFSYEATINGREHYYRITQNDKKHGVEQDGVMIAEIAHGEAWQLSAANRSAKNSSTASASTLGALELKRVHKSSTAVPSKTRHYL